MRLLKLNALRSINRFKMLIEEPLLLDRKSRRDEILIATGFNPWVRLSEKDKSATHRSIKIRSLYWRAFMSLCQMNMISCRSKLLVIDIAQSTRSFFGFFDPGLKPGATQCHPSGILIIDIKIRSSFANFSGTNIKLNTLC